MLKADKLYKKERTVTTFSPYYIPNNSETINICPILNQVKNSDDIFKINSIFNCFKYSMFVPIISGCLDYFTRKISTEWLMYLYTIYANNIDYIMTNIKGPSFCDFDMNVTDVHFLMTSKSEQIIYNIISTDHHMNIICTFKKGFVKKRKFEKCIYMAYKELFRL